MKFKAIFVDPEQQHLTVPSKEFGYVSNNAASSVFGGWEGNCVFGQGYNFAETDAPGRQQIF